MNAITQISTSSNRQDATSVSPLDAQATAQSDSSLKREFLNSFTSHKLRKNAKEKITQLLAYADSVTLKTQSMGMDDCFRSNAPQNMPKAAFWQWYEDNYSEMVIKLTVREGVLVKAVFSDCIYHFSDDVVLTFSEVIA
ncbi:hypothetical protein [Vibrio parahaemolyticus]|uniref:Uncharacterized protein n=1 Tax=Vibrio parahaemolyticus TaxID=670 RepID=A0AA47JNQ2_VIBPH|nr:hypothetical protein [Vibrio parahaemolyticus]MCR9648273.1 hypothetical protein [Vibrio parahaemolyticus]MCR9801928.1 hypothetical protein [Vibrio parahaemolyticus]MDF4922254.1 hypothetical protein [Vibrio parahaemolyticus]MDG3059090.1 hypothetical protein [Vibrio parahaemolyticus]MEA5339269.1 hypothetical protein [Vibrio parahaemolyticus]